MVILFFVVYFFGILICQGVTDYRARGEAQNNDLEQMYGSLMTTIYTLFAAISQGVDWMNIVTPLKDLHIAYSIGVVLYIALVIFGVTNVVTSVFVESAVMSAQHYRELIVQENRHQKEVAMMHLKEVFKEMDQD